MKHRLWVSIPCKANKGGVDDEDYFTKDGFCI